jgi:hypothetical protein
MSLAGVGTKRLYGNNASREYGWLKLYEEDSHKLSLSLEIQGTIVGHVNQLTPGESRQHQW